MFTNKQITPNNWAHRKDLKQNQKNQYGVHGPSQGTAGEEVTVGHKRKTSNLIDK